MCTLVINYISPSALIFEKFRVGASPTPPSKSASEFELRFTGTKQKSNYKEHTTILSVNLAGEGVGIKILFSCTAD